MARHSFHVQLGKKRCQFFGVRGCSFFFLKFLWKHKRASLSKSKRFQCKCLALPGCMAPAASPKSWRKTSIWRPASWGPEGRFAGRIWLLKGWWHLANALYTYPFLSSLSPPRKADCKCNRLCCRSVYQYLSGWGMHIPYKLLPASLFLHMRLIGPEVHALSGPRPHQMGCLAYYPSLWGVVVIYSCLFEHWKGKAYMRDVFLFFLACKFCCCQVHWMNKKGFTQTAMVKMIAGTMRGFFSGFFGHKGATISATIGLPQMIPSIPGNVWAWKIRTQLHQYHMASLGPLGEVGEGVDHNANKWPQKTIQMRKREEQNLGWVWHSVAIALIRWGHCPHQLHPRWCVWSIVWTCLRKADICLGSFTKNGGFSQQQLPN